MAPAAEEDEHLFFEAHLPASARALDYAFVLDDGRCVGREGGAGQAFRVEPRALAAPPPAWWRDAVLYTIFVDRFRRGGWPDDLGARPERARAGGDLEGVVEAIDHLVDLGVTALHLTPIVVAPSAHRYDSIDPRAVDPALGGEPALRRLLDEAQRIGLKVLLDLGLKMVHRDFAPFQDVRRRGPDSPYWRWFHARRWPFTEGLDPGYEHYQKGAWEEPLLDTGHEEVIEHLAASAARWAALGADGLRIDAAADLPLAAIRAVARAVRAARPGAALFGEVIPGNVHRWTGGLLDAATDSARRMR
jgi:glycosidase